MFTGIITAVGTIATLAGAHCRIRCPLGWLANTVVGDSIAVDGACLTVTEIVSDSGDLEADYFTCDISAETRHCCAPLAVGQSVNLEQALALGDKLGGHIVSGHIDATAEIRAQIKDESGGCCLQVQAPAALLPLLAQKGSVALAGVSLTINTIQDDTFSVYLLAHTLAHTTLAQYPTGRAINIETDLLARHVARLIGK